MGQYNCDHCGAGIHSLDNVDVEHSVLNQEETEIILSGECPECEEELSVYATGPMSPVE